MIEFKVSISELEELAESVPNLTLILDAMQEHTEIRLVLDKETSATIPNSAN